MKIYYQWIKGAYSFIASKAILLDLSKQNLEIEWVVDFESVWKAIAKGNIWILPIENSYTWSIHENLYNFLRNDFQVIWEFDLKIEHALLSKEKRLEDITKAYSHPQALSQCYNFLQKHNIKAIQFWDTAWAAQMISESGEKWAWSISSEPCAEIYGLNIIKTGIQDQPNNTTRFFIVKNKETDVSYSIKKWKITILFEARDMPAILYKCLWAFATNSINLTKIESIPSLKDPFTHMFWLSFEWNLNDNRVIDSLNELEFFTKRIQILGEY